MKTIRSLLAMAGLFATWTIAEAHEFEVKREPVFEFALAPKLIRNNDQVTISFETKGLCDVTVAIEDAQGKIVRHLASGVLGPKAPAPLQPNTKAQTLIWDGKNDQGEYLDHPETLSVRVSLGLKPQFERSLYCSPYKRIDDAAPMMAACEDGVVVSEGKGIDRIQLFGHDGAYLRTIYPFPAAKLSEVKGLDWKDFPQGVRYPWKQSQYQQTFLTSGDNSLSHGLSGMSGRAASTLAVSGKRMVLANQNLNRLALDGSTGGMDLLGGSTSFPLPPFRTWVGPKTIRATPTSSALSPDGKWLYLAGYAYRIPTFRDTLSMVARMPVDGSENAKVFLGKIHIDSAGTATGGTGQGEFRNATSVDCDGAGRVYISDFMNDRIQVFSPEGQFLKEIKTLKPAVVKVNRKTGEIWIFSWLVASRLWQGADPAIDVEASLTRFRSFDDPQVIARSEFPVGKSRFTSNGKIEPFMGHSSALWFSVEVDFWAQPVTVWIGADEWGQTLADRRKSSRDQSNEKWNSLGIRLFREQDGKWREYREFSEEVRKHVICARPPTHGIQRLEVSPVNGRLYVGEADSGPTYKSSNDLLEIEPETGKQKLVELPFSAMEYAFDLNGHIYLRKADLIVRYDHKTFREVPFDYGEEREKVGELGSGGVRTANVTAGLPLPSKNVVCFHQGGIHVNVHGQILASCGYRFAGIGGFVPGTDVGALAASGAWTQGRLDFEAMAAVGGEPYKPRLYPGRISNSTSPCFHIFDKHGKRIVEDAVPGVAQVDGVGLDRDGNIYFMHTPTRMLEGKPYMNPMSETLTKVKPRQAKVISTDPRAAVVLPAEDRPARPPEVGSTLKEGWVEGAEWFYGGVGYAGFNAPAPSCACWFSRFALDYFARSIAPEPQLFSIAVLDSSGNLILRIGRYGNVDDGKPLVENAAQPSAHAIGGDEVALFHACYVGTHTDRRIFIADHGNGRILSVKLGYHTEERIGLKGAVGP